jgi:hypothetical protein
MGQGSFHSSLRDLIFLWSRAPATDMAGYYQSPVGLITAPANGGFSPLAGTKRTARP